jgi:GTP-binding protein
MEYAPIIPVSAKNGDGIDKLLNTAVRMYGQLTTHIETASLNKYLEKWLIEYPTPSGPQTRFKVKYAVQKSENPIVFIFFVSRVRAVTEPYIASLRNKIRRDLGFSLIPVTVEIRSSKKE